VVKKIYNFSLRILEGVENLPLLGYFFINQKIDLTPYDFLIFTSKIAVESINASNPTWKHIPSISIGTKTTELIKELGGSVVYESKSGYGKDLPNEIYRFCVGKKLLYPRGKEVSNDLKNISNLDIDEAIVYKTVCRDGKMDIDEESILLFSSPKVVRCFNKLRGFRNGDIVICIGESTAKELPSGVKYLLPEVMSLESMATLAKTL